MDPDYIFIVNIFNFHLKDATLLFFQQLESGLTYYLLIFNIHFNDNIFKYWFNDRVRLQTGSSKLTTDKVHKLIKHEIPNQILVTTEAK